MSPTSQFRTYRLRQSAPDIFRMDDGDRLHHRRDDQLCHRSGGDPVAACRGAGRTRPPSLLHPVQLIESLIDAASE